MNLKRWSGLSLGQATPSFYLQKRNKAESFKLPTLYMT